jgi:opacity protein-like surface antigen
MLAAVAALSATAANAADLPLPPVQAPIVEEFGGWYLRGDIGMSNQRVNSLFNVLYDTASSVNTVQKDFDSAPFFGVGVGYQYRWFRFDVTGEYRGKANFHGLDIATSGGTTFTDEYRASKSEWLFLANVYAELGTWWYVTPFVGVGIGGSYNTISNFIDVCTTCAGGGVATGATESKWNFAWALHAGLAYRASKNLTVELAYRYVNLGDALSGDLVTYLGGNAVNNPMHFRGLSSHDVKLGVRWMLEPPQPAPVMLPPLVRRG